MGFGSWGFWGLGAERFALVLGPSGLGGLIGFRVLAGSRASRGLERNSWDFGVCVIIAGGFLLYYASILHQAQTTI